MATVKRLCVYCGSSRGADEAYAAAATRFGRLIAEAGIELVYGGGRVGLMGLLADGALAAGGRVVGIIPAHLHDYEIGHRGLSELIVVGSMHERKRRMFEISDAFAVLPGGLGTLDETFEMITWRQLRLHDKPIVIVDERGYWAPLRALIEHIVAQAFAPPTSFELFRFVPSVEDVLPTIAAMPQPQVAPETKLV
jgi:uncharacterized protein (TIGR00730 family)